MARETVLAMLRALPGVKEDGGNLLVDDEWELTMHAGRQGSVLAFQHISRIGVQPEFLVAEGHKGQRIVILLEEVRGFTADPSTAERKGRRPGFSP